MKIIGVLTENFSLYYDLVRTLREKGLPFVSLEFDEPIPRTVGVILTSRFEQPSIAFEGIIGIEAGPEMEKEQNARAKRDEEPDEEPDENRDEDTDAPRADRTYGSLQRDAAIQRAINSAVHLLAGGDEYTHLVIGVDPGKRPGIAVIGDGTIVNTYQAPSVERTAPYIDQMLATYPSKRVTIRIGHGATTQRNRIINALLERGCEVEIVDETNTSERVEDRDIHAAINIAITQGEPVHDRFAIHPTDGELKNIQRLSRLESSGKVTIGRNLARRVALGELTLAEALKEHTSGREREDKAVAVAVEAAGAGNLRGANDEGDENENGNGNGSTEKGTPIQYGNR